MYKGNHPTALNSQKLLLEALNNLLKEKNYKDISISEICSHSGISRQTFYSLFGTKEDIILYQLEQDSLSQKARNQHSSQMTLAEICDLYSEFVVSNYKQFKMLIDNELMDVLNAHIFQSLVSCRQNFVNLNDKDREYASLFMSAGLCHLAQKYIQEHKNPNQQELARIAFKVMSGDIYLKS